MSLIVDEGYQFSGQPLFEELSTLLLPLQSFNLKIARILRVIYDSQVRDYLFIELWIKLLAPTHLNSTSCGLLICKANLGKVPKTIATNRFFASCSVSASCFAISNFWFLMTKYREQNTHELSLSHFEVRTEARTHRPGKKCAARFTESLTTRSFGGELEPAGWSEVQRAGILY